MLYSFSGEAHFMQAKSLNENVKLSWSAMHKKPCQIQANVAIYQKAPRNALKPSANF
jgi:hypothetical protein